MQSYIFSIITSVFMILQISFWFANLVLKKVFLLLLMLKAFKMINIFVKTVINKKTGFFDI